VTGHLMDTDLLCRTYVSRYVKLGGSRGASAVLGKQSRGLWWRFNNWVADVGRLQEESSSLCIQTITHIERIVRRQYLWQTHYHLTYYFSLIGLESSQRHIYYSPASQSSCYYYDDSAIAKSRRVQDMQSQPQDQF
jgi:hypothetical protein